MTPYYDNLSMEPDSEGWVDFERIYCFAWDDFDNDAMDRLWTLIRTIPRFVTQSSDGCYWWYSDREDVETGYLTVGVELPGLQVFGTLPLSCWESWQHEFQHRVTGFPVRKLD